MNETESAPQFEIACLNLRSKEMYHQAAGQEEDQFCSGLYWCGRTNETFGPDGQPVGKSECSGGRPCYAR
jgi:hypothetical protein